jgi:hypothetical protein
MIMTTDRKRRRVIKGHSPESESSLVVRPGEVLTFERRPTPWRGWIWCIDEAGNAAWLPESWGSTEGTAFKMLRDYDSTELTVNPGQEFDVHETESGWALGISSSGELGWIPLDCLEE